MRRLAGGNATLARDLLVRPPAVQAAQEF